MECPEVVRIRVKKCDGRHQSLYKNLCVDPQITSFDGLQNLLGRAFEIKSDFTISYLSANDLGEEVYLTMLSDWDVDAAFLGASRPFLRLKVDTKPFDMDDWDVLDASCIQKKSPSALNLDKSFLNSLTGRISQQIGKTVSNVSKAIGFRSDDFPDRPRLTDAAFHNYMNGVGQMMQPQKFRLTVYQGGVEPSLRKVVWRHLLNIFPEEMTGKERFDYLRRKSQEYTEIREEWMKALSSECPIVVHVCNMVKKDVVRTDRTHEFYAGSDENKNVTSLFNLLVTFAMTHPDLGYCQGMSDIASPILFVQKDEAHAYICFCGAMRRLCDNFKPDGCTMSTKFDHLGVLLQHFDPRFYDYLCEHSAHDLFFCYRWLLLELKREFPLDDALFMLEIMWSSLPPDPPAKDLCLVDPLYLLKGINSCKVSDRSNKGYKSQVSRNRNNSLSSQNGSEALDCIDSGLASDKDLPVRTNVISTVQKRKTGEAGCQTTMIDKPLSELSKHNIHDILSEESNNKRESDLESLSTKGDNNHRRPSNICLQNISYTESTDNEVNTTYSLCEEASENLPDGVHFDGSECEKGVNLPAVEDIGHGNPFLLFLCLSLLVMHRDYLMKQKMDYNEIAMFFNKLVRKHNVHDVVHHAKYLYGLYLKSFHGRGSLSEESYPNSV